MAEAIKKEDLNRDGVVSKQEAKAFAAGQGETLGVVSKQDENLKTLDTKGTVSKTDDTFAKVPGADAKDLNEDGVVSAEELAALAAAKIIGLAYPEVREKISQFQEQKRIELEEADAQIQ